MLADQYEFDAAQNEILRRSARLTTVWGVVAVLAGLLVAYWGVRIMADPESWAEVAASFGTAIPLIVVGLASLRIGGRLMAIVGTEGNDVTHFMDAVSAVGRAFMLQAILIVGWIGLMVAVR